MQQENKKIAKNTSVEMFCQNISTKSKGFTLVELIIVITILGILATIAFISFQGYTKDARDGIRMSDIKQIYNGLSIYKTQTEKTLLPDNYINIQSGTTTISYQGYAGAGVLRNLKISGGKDPGTKDYYIYTTDVNTRKAQLMTYMETTDKDVQLLSQIKNLNIINQVQALTNTGYYQDKKIYVYGDKIGILTDSNKVPLQETTSTGINLLTTTTPLTTYFGGNVYSGGLSTSTGLTLINQINGAINSKLPCNGEAYNGYAITSLQDSQTGTFTKSTLPSNGTQTGTLNISCSNGLLNYSTKIETFSSLVCNSGYILSSGNCIKISNVSSFATNLSAYWPMDNSWNDSISTKHGTPNGSPTFTTGLINQAGNFTGSNYLNMGNVLDVGGGDFTMSARVNPTTSDQQVIFEKIQQSGSPWPGYRLRLYSGATHYAGFSMNTSSGPNTCDSSGTIPIPTGSWTQIVVSRIGGTISLYVNGVLDKSGSCSGNSSNSNNFYIGLLNGTTSLNAQIDDAAVWIGRGLTSTEVANLY